jgi:hypothetical protein
VVLEFVLAGFLSSFVPPNARTVFTQPSPFNSSLRADCELLPTLHLAPAHQQTKDNHHCTYQKVVEYLAPPNPTLPKDLATLLPPTEPKPHCHLESHHQNFLVFRNK